MVNVGDLVSIKYLSDIHESEPNYIVVKVDTVTDKLNLYRYRKYKLFDYTSGKMTSDITVWDHQNGLKYNLVVYKHNCYTYPYSLYFKWFNRK